MCVDSAVAAWCATPIALGPGSAMVPTVLGPDRVPVLSDSPHTSHTPELAVLSALAHGADPERRGVLDVLLNALATIDPSLADLYCDLVLAELPEAARCYLEELMATGTHEYRSDYARRYFFEGEAAGKAASVLAVLDARGIDVSTGSRTRIAECSDLDQLDAWVRRAVTAETVDDLFV